MYHERQTRQMCLVHALNALFQKPQFTAETLDEICYSLSDKRWFNPHRSMLGLGNYDVNVLMSALGMYDYQHNVHFERCAGTVPELRNQYERSLSIILKRVIVFSMGQLCVLIDSQKLQYHHLKKTQFFNLDSKLSKPEEITDITQHCRNLLSRTEDSNQLFLVGKEN